MAKSKMRSVVPSIIARTQVELDERLKKIVSLKPKSVQLDVMDGVFVNSTSLEFDFKLSEMKAKGIAFEAHLMVNRPDVWYLENKAKVKSVIVHYESYAKIHDFIKTLNKDRKTVGIAINPETPAEALLQYIKLIDKVLIMTVKPGAYGGKFLPDTLGKITHLRGLKVMNNKLSIAVDGGLTPETIELCRAAGANEFVVGSYLQNSKNVKQSWKALENSLE